LSGIALFLLDDDISQARRFAEAESQKESRKKKIEASHRNMPPEISLDRGAEADTRVDMYKVSYQATPGQRDMTTGDKQMGQPLDQC
jgi:hypothetical protein